MAPDLIRYGYSRMTNKKQEYQESAIEKVLPEDAESLDVDVIEDVIEGVAESVAYEESPAPVPTGSDETMDVCAEIASSVKDIMIEVDGLAYPDTTVAGSLDYLVRRSVPNEITYIYVIDEERVLQGVVALRDLLLAKPGQTLLEIMRPQPVSFQVETSIRDAISVALNTHHRLYPVLDDDGRIVGMVYGWQLFERVASELSVQTGSTVGLNKEERITTPVLSALKMRHPWLQVNLVTAFIAALVVGFFEDTIAQILVLAVFLPVLAGQSGNTGCQALAITLRGITLGELENFPLRRLYTKELLLGAFNGIGAGLVAALVMYLYAGSTGTENAAMLALVILVAMVGACMGSGFFGVAVPLALRRFGADPAMASSIFLTTLTDVLGMGLMLLLATTLVL